MPAALACPACRTQQVFRRGDPLCPACAQQARETVAWPLWLFDSPLLRRALADLNVPAVPAIVRAACGLSQRDLAGVVGWSPAALSYYERGQRDAVFDVRTLLQFADAVGMPRAALLPLILADPDARLAADRDDGTSMEVGRRRFGGLVAGAAAAAVLPAASVPWPTCSSRVRYWEACADALYIRDREVGGTVLLQPALRQWQLVRRVLPEAGRADQKLLAAAGELALCAGWIALDGGLSARNRASYGAGLADALLRQGARHEAVAAAMDVLPVLEGGVTSIRCVNRLRLVRQAAGNTAGAEEFCVRFDAIERALAASCVLPDGDAPGFIEDHVDLGRLRPAG